MTLENLHLFFEKVCALKIKVFEVFLRKQKKIKFYLKKNKRHINRLNSFNPFSASYHFKRVLDSPRKI